MAKVGRWSSTPGSNNSTPPDGFPEGQAPSTLNDGMREVMAQVRTVFNDAQYFDQDMTPTFINATSFSVPGNQTSAIHAGRRLKLYDANPIYATVSTASFTTVTTINVSTDGGASLTSSLSSFGIAILSNTNNSLPRNANLSTSALAIIGTLSVGGATTLADTLSVSGAAAIGGAVRMDSTLSVSGTVVAANIAKAWVSFIPNSTSAGNACIINSSFNVDSVSRSATGTFRVSFTNAFADILFLAIVDTRNAGGGLPVLFHMGGATAGAGFYKFQTVALRGTAVTQASGSIHCVFYR